MFGFPFPFPDFGFPLALPGMLPFPHLLPLDLVLVSFFFVDGESDFKASRVGKNTTEGSNYRKKARIMEKMTAKIWLRASLGVPDDSSCSEKSSSSVEIEE